MADSQASLLLRKQLKDLSRNPVDGFSAGLVDDSNVFEWNVTIIGPPDTLYEGGYFNAIMSFPPKLPEQPSISKVHFRDVAPKWPYPQKTLKPPGAEHGVFTPNVYPDGRVCISILHAPGDDPNGYELASERWSPVHTVETILLSIISMLSSPNDESPANIDAALVLKVLKWCAVLYFFLTSKKEWRETKEDFKRKVSRIVRRSQETL